MTDGYEFTDADPETVLVIRSILPVFTNDLERPERIGTCVLARIDGHPFIVTAAHVVREPQQVSSGFTFAVGGRLIRIRTNRFVTPPSDPADIGLIPIPL